MYAATRGPNVKWGGHIFQMGGLEPLAPMLATALVCCTPVYINIFKENIYKFLKKQEEGKPINLFTFVNPCGCQSLGICYTAKARLVRHS